MTVPFWIGDCRIEPTRNIIVADEAASHSTPNPGPFPGSGKTKSIEPKVMSVLCLLAQSQGKVVKRSTLLDQVWSDQVVSDEILTRAISILRKAFREFTSEPVIETISKNGYRLTQEVRVSNVGSTPRVLLPLAAIAVMPFDNLSIDGSHAFLARGITRDLANLLSRIPGLRVVPPITTESLKDEFMSAKDAGRMLNARYLVTGELERRGNSFRVRTSLTDAESERLVWSANQDENMDTFFQVQDQLVHGIATSLSTEVSVSRVQALIARPAFSLSAYEHIQLAEDARRYYGKEAAEQVVFQLLKALEIQPDNAEAHAYLAEQYAQNIVSRFSSDPGRDADRVRQHLEHAQLLSPSDPRVLRAAGVVGVMSGDYEETLRVTRQSIDRNPSDPHTQALYGFARGMTGEVDEGIEQIRSAEERAPGHPRYSVWPQYRGWLLYAKKDYEGFVDAFRQATLRNPNYLPPHFFLAFGYSLLDEWPLASYSLQKGLRLSVEYVAADFRASMTHLGFSAIFKMPEWKAFKTFWEQELNDYRHSGERPEG